MTPKGKDVEEFPADICGELFIIIDNFLADISNQSLVDSYKVQDFCLDVRLFVSNHFKENIDE